MRTRFLLLAILLPVLNPTSRPDAYSFAPFVSAAEKPVKRRHNEGLERKVDLLALDAQEKAISSLRKSAQTEKIQLRLAEQLRESADILFRIANGDAYVKNKKTDFSRYHKRLGDSIGVLSSWLNRFPNSKKRQRALALRAAAYDELKKQTLAEKDFMAVTKLDPTTYEALSAFMALAEYGAKDNLYEKILPYLEAIEKHPESKRYPFALYRKAWALYNLKRYDQGIDTLSKHIKFYQDLEEKEQGLLSSDMSVLENSVSDLSMFYFDGQGAQIKSFSAAGAVKFFKERVGDIYVGRSVTRLAKLLKSHRHAEALNDLTSYLESKLPKNTATMEVALVTFEYFTQQREFDEALKSSERLARLKPTGDTLAKVQQAILEFSKDLQLLISKNKEATEVRSLVNTLNRNNKTFFGLVDTSDPRIPIVYHNHAELAFDLKDYEAATLSYRAAYDFLKSKRPVPELKDEEVLLKSVASRYQDLLGKKQIPEKLDLKTIKLTSKSLAKPVEEFVAWVDEYSPSPAKFSAALEPFAFEIPRMYFSIGNFTAGSKRIEQDLPRFESLDRKKILASLLLDSKVEAKDWASAEALALQVKAYFGSDASFKEGLDKLASESSAKKLADDLKVLDAPKKIAAIDLWILKYPNSGVSAEVLWLAVESAQQIGNRDLINARLKGFIAKFPNSPKRAYASLVFGQFAEEDLEYQSSAEHYLKFLESKPKENIAIEAKKKILYYSWISGNGPLLKKTLATTSLCEGSLEATCVKYREFLEVRTQKNKGDWKKSKVPALGALAALESLSEYTFWERGKLVRALVKSWEQLEPMERMLFLPRAKSALVHTFKNTRELLDRVDRIRNSESSILRRLEQVREMDSLAAQALNFPSTALKHGVLSEVGILYTSTLDQISKLDLEADLKNTLVSSFKKRDQELKAAIGTLKPTDRKVALNSKEPAPVYLVESWLTGRSSPFPQTGKDAPKGIPVPKALILWKKAFDQKNFPLASHLVNLIENNKEVPKAVRDEVRERTIASMIDA